MSSLNDGQELADVAAGFRSSVLGLVELDSLIEVITCSGFQHSACRRILGIAPAALDTGDVPFAHPLHHGANVLLRDGDATNDLPGRGDVAMQKVRYSLRAVVLDATRRFASRLIVFLSSSTF